jgi:hypothetical protein
MAYGVRFIGTVPVGQTLDGNAWSVEILERDYAGVSSTITLAAGAPIVSWGEAGSDRFNPILSSSAEIHIFDKANAVINAVLDADEEQYRVCIKKNSDIYWIGKLVTDQIEETRDKRPRMQTFQAIDGLGPLADVAYTATGRVSVVQALSDLLETTGLGLNMSIASNWFLPGMTSVNDPLFLVRLDCGVFVPDDHSVRNCGDVLSEILERFGLQLKQVAGVWEIVQVELLASGGAYRYFVYDSTGTYLSTSTIDPSIEITEDQGYQFRKADGIKQFRRPYKETIVEFLPVADYRDTIVNGDFADWFTDPVQGLIPTGWQKSSNDMLLGSQNFDDAFDGTCVNLGDVGSGAGLPTDYIEMTDASLAVGMGANNMLRFRSSAMLTAGSMPAPVTPPRHAWIQIEVGDYCLIEDHGAYVWAVTADTPFADRWIQWKGVVALSHWGVGFDHFVEFIVDTPKLDTSMPGGVVKVRLSQVVDQWSGGATDIAGGIFWTGIVCEVLPAGGVGVGIRTIATDSASVTTGKRDVRTFVIGDGCSTSSRSVLTNNSNVVIAQNWKRGAYAGEDVLTGASIDTMLAGSWLMAQKKQSLQANQEVYTRKGIGVGVAVEANNILVIGGTMFAPVEFTRDLAKGKASGEFVEVRNDGTNVTYTQQTIVDGTASGGGSGSGGASGGGGWTTHTHTINQVLGLQTALDAKAPLVHTHAGLVTAEAQTWYGVKSFMSGIITEGLSTTQDIELESGLNAKWKTDTIGVHQFLQGDPDVAVDAYIQLPASSGRLALLTDVSGGTSTLLAADNYWTGASNTYKNAVYLGSVPAATRGTLKFYDPTSTYYSTLSVDVLTTNRALTIPDVAGTLATLDGGQTFTSAVWHGTAIGVGYGGTGISSYAAGDLLYASATTTLSKLPIGSEGKLLAVVGGALAWTNTVTVVGIETNYVLIGEEVGFGFVDIYRGDYRARIAPRPLSADRTFLLPDVAGGGAPTFAMLDGGQTFTDAVWHGTAIGDSYISSASTWSAKQAAYTNLTSIGSLADAAGWLHNNGSGTFAYSTPSKSDVGLGSVENTALSTWAGTANITTVGTIVTGVWHGTAIADTYISSAATWNAKQAAYTNLTSIGNLADAAGWLHNNGSGTFVYSTPSKSDVGLGSVENTALSTWAGTANITTVGTIVTGVWHGTAIDHAYLTGIAQADVAGLTTASSPSFAGLTLNGALSMGTNAISSVGAITSSGLLGVTVASGYAATFMGGNVGIGTTAPVAPLTVTGALFGGAATLDLRDSQAIATNAGGGIFFGGKYTGSTYTEWGYIRGNKDNATDGNYDGSLRLASRDATGFHENLVLASDGNVGIGTTAPVAPLTVTGALFGGAANLDLRDSQAIATNAGGGIFFGGKYTGSTYTEWGYIRGNKDNATDGNYDGSLRLASRDTTGFHENLVLASDGNVGIGTTDPLGYKLYNNGTFYNNGNATFAGTLASAGVASNWYPSLTDTYDLGSSTKLWRKGWLSEMDAILFAENTQTLLGGWFNVGKDEGVLPSAVSSGDTTIDFGKAMTTGHFVLFRAALQMEYMQVGSVVSGTTYNVTRNLDGTGANDWPAGSVFCVRGTTGDGWIELNAYDTPRLSMFTQGATYNAQNEYIRIGDLNGMPSYTAPHWGIYIGDATNYLKYDKDSTTLSVAGAIAILPGSSGYSNLSGIPNTTYIDSSGIYTGTLTATQVNAAGVTVLGAVTSGSIVVGTTNKMWFNDSSDGSLAIGGATKATAPFRVSSVGAMTSTSGSVGGWIIGAETIATATYPWITLDSASKTIHLIADADTDQFQNLYIGQLIDPSSYDWNGETGIQYISTEDHSEIFHLSQAGFVFSGSGVFSGTIYATAGTFAGSLSAATGTFAGSLTAGSGTISGSLLVQSTITVGDSTHTGIIQSSDYNHDAVTGWKIGKGIAEFNGSSINGATITGGTIRTAASGQRVVITGATNSLDFYAVSGTAISIKSPSEGVLSVDHTFVIDRGDGSLASFDTTAIDIFDGSHHTALSYGAYAGAIKFDGTHFYGYNGTTWKQLDN